MIIRKREQRIGERPSSLPLWAVCSHSYALR